jgi:hypothetical protein
MLKLRRNKLTGLGLILPALLVLGAWAMHEFYVSITEIRYNAQRERFEISMRIFPDDLDRALLERNGIHTQLATALEHDLADSLLMLYLLEDFSLEVDGEELGLTYLGKEAESNAIWCYLESSVRSAPETIKIRNRILTEYFPDQVNIIQVYRGKWNKGLMLDRNESSGTLHMGR